MKSPKKESKELACSSMPLESDVLRHWTAKNIDLSKLPLPKRVEEQILVETEQEINSLNVKNGLEERQASLQEVEEIQLKVRARHQDQFYEARIRLALWNESERILKILRTRGLGVALDESTLRQRTIEYITQIDLKLFPEANPRSSLYWGADPLLEEEVSCPDNTSIKLPPTTISPNDYFEQTCPEIVASFGYPFYVTLHQRLNGINTDFFAAYLAGQRRFKHDVLFFLPESRFYFYDPMARQYIPTSEEKLRILLSLILQERAWGYYMDHASTILTQFRRQEVMDEILGKTKTLLATARGFFDQNGDNPRLVVEEQGRENLQATIQVFLEAKVCMDENGILTVTDFMKGLKNYLQERGTSVPRNRYQEIKTLVQANMREIHGKGVRHDLILEDGGLTKGWKGLRLRNQTQPDVVPIKELSEMQESGPSDVSMKPSILLNQEDIPANPERN
jgi:hypothetical protein